MLRGILAAIAGCAVMYLPCWFILFHLTAGMGDVFIAAKRELNIDGTGVVLILLIALSFISGIVTRLISRGRFYWTAIPFFLALAFIFTRVKFDYAANGMMVFYLILITLCMLVLILVSYWGWKMIKKREEKKMFVDAPAGSHLR